MRSIRRLLALGARSERWSSGDAGAAGPGGGMTARETYEEEYARLVRKYEAATRSAFRRLQLATLLGGLFGMVLALPPTMLLFASILVQPGGVALAVLLGAVVTLGGIGLGQLALARYERKRGL